MSADPVMNYVNAYEKANGERCPYAITYARGWFTLRNMQGREMPIKKRLADLEAMTSVLKARQSQKVGG